MSIPLKNRSHRRRQVKPIVLGPKQIFKVESLTHDAKGVARLEGKVTFISGALPGEEVEAQVIKAGKRYDEAQLIKILTESEDRIAPLCAHFNECGGCSFQHVKQAYQIKSKQQWMLGQLRKVVDGQSISVLSDQPFAYRRRARIAIKVENGKVLIGFRGKASSKIVAIEQCHVLTLALQTTFNHLKTELLQHDIAQDIGHIELLEDDKGVGVTIRLMKNIAKTVQNHWQQWADRQNISLYWQVPEASSAQVVEGEQRYYDLDGMTLHYHPQDFIQVNALLNRKMVDQAMDWLAPSIDDVVLDLFCGMGNFSLPLAKRAKQVVGVEVQSSMVEAGKANAHFNRLTNLKFISADLTKAVGDEITGLGLTKVLLDPPRAGAFEFLPTLVKLNPKKILYVSCDAATLARDAEYLVSQGYQVKRVGMMDMFPQTSHVECMMLLER